MNLQVRYTVLTLYLKPWMAHELTTMIPIVLFAKTYLSFLRWR